MKIDRRSFLSLGIGAAAGVGLSPLPWKLQDDLSIWTQNWPWTPVPSDGAASYVNSVCTLCPGGCGITVRKIDNRAVKIEGMAGHPVNDGGICLLGLSGLQLLYGPRRIQGPMKKVDGKWKKITWEEGINELVSKISEAREAGASDGIGCISGFPGGTLDRLLERLLMVCGSANMIRTVSMNDTYSMILKLMHGTEANIGFEIDKSDFVLSFGSGLIEGWGSPVRMILANSAVRDNGGKVVQVEPRLSHSAAKADKWIAINPGTETDLALGIAHVIIREGLINREFIEGYTNGFDGGFKELVIEKYTPESVAQTTGVEKSTIESLAKSFAGAKNPVAICGKGQGKQAGSLREFAAVHALNALVGNIGKEGGVLELPKPSYIEWPEPELDEKAKAGFEKPRLDGAGTDKFQLATSLPHRLAALAGSLKVLLIAETNPAYSLPDVKSVRKAIDSVPFVVSFSTWMNETADLADLILPNHAYLERYEDVPSPFGMNKPVVGVTRPVVEPQFETKNIGDVIIETAKGLEGGIAEAFPWDDYESCLKETMGEENWEVLENDGFLANADYTVPALEEAFKTASGKFEFNSELIADAAKKVDAPGKGSMLLIPYDSIRIANDFVGNPPFMMKTVEPVMLKRNDGFIDINPKTAKSLGIKEGDGVVVSTDNGKVKLLAHLTGGVAPNTLAIARGLGHIGSDEYLCGKGVNVNELLPPIEDPATGLDAGWGIHASLKKA